jgi:uncharacterized membrane protein
MTKYRLETFSDGVIAIIITIMVLSIPLPKSFNLTGIIEFGVSLFIYLLSFLVVGAFWNQHNQAFRYLDKINHKIIIANILFLFFLSLIPLFTKWVIENPGSLIPVIGYDVIYLAVSFFYVLTFRLIIEETDDKEILPIKEAIKSRKDAGSNFSWKPVFILLLLVLSLIVFSIYLPKASTVILMGIPIASSIFNLFISEHQKTKSRFGIEE